MSPLRGELTRLYGTLRLRWPGPHLTPPSFLLYASSVPPHRVCQLLVAVAPSYRFYGRRSDSLYSACVPLREILPTQSTARGGSKNSTLVKYRVYSYDLRTIDACHSLQSLPQGLTARPAIPFSYGPITQLYNYASPTSSGAYLDPRMLGQGEARFLC